MRHVGLATRLTGVLIAVMLAQSAAGLLLPTAYRDPDWVRAAWFGNDAFTLVVAAPLMWLGCRHRTTRSSRGLLLWLGLLGYDVYNYAFYLFGAALNVFLPLYVVAFVLAIVTLGCVLIQTDVSAVAQRFRRETPVRWIGGYLVFVACVLATVWLLFWGASVFNGRPTPVEPEAFKVAAALDLSLMVPSMLVGGVLLWQRTPAGFLLSTIASIQGALYLWVLVVNSRIALRRGLATSPGELPVWVPLAACTSIAAAVLVRNSATP